MDNYGTRSIMVQLLWQPRFHPTPSLIGYGFFLGWAGVCFGCSGVGVGLCSRTIFPTQEMYAPMISSGMIADDDRRPVQREDFIPMRLIRLLWSLGVGEILKLPLTKPGHLRV